MKRNLLNMAFSRSLKEETRMSIAARILAQQDQEPWKRTFDAYSDRVNAKRAQREADARYVQDHPWRAFVYLAVRRMFR